MGHLDSGRVEQGQCRSDTCAPLYPNSRRGLSCLVCVPVPARFAAFCEAPNNEGKGREGGRPGRRRIRSRMASLAHHHQGIRSSHSSVSTSYSSASPVSTRPLRCSFVCRPLSFSLRPPSKRFSSASYVSSNAAALRAGGRVLCCAQREKVSVQERSQEEKDRELALEYERKLGEEEEEEEGAVREDEEEEEYLDGDEAVFNAAGGVEDFGEVSKILSARVVDGEVQYLIEWKDDHPDSWEPPSNIARFASCSSRRKPSQLLAENGNDSRK